MGWSVSYQLVRATPLSEAERAAVAAHAARFAAGRWPVEPYAPEAPAAGTVVVRGVTKMPWSTTAPSWPRLLAALTELRTLIADASCEVFDDFEAISWSEADRRYAVVRMTAGPSAARRPRSSSPSAPRAVGFRWVRVEPHQRYAHVVIRDDDVVRLDLRGDRARLQAAVFVRTAIAAQLEQATARLLAADGAELAVADRTTWSGFDLAPATIAQLAMIELVATTVTPCEGYPVARLAVSAIGADGEVALSPIEGWPRYPRAVFAPSLRRTADGLAVDCDGSAERLLLQRDLTIDFIVFTAGGAELARASVVGGLADHHAVAIALARERLAEVRRFDVRITGTLRQTARVGRWQLVRKRGGARPAPRP